MLLQVKTIHADAPYAGGWTKVSASNMSDTWTALDNATTFDLMPELGADGNPVDSSQTKPDMDHSISPMLPRMI